MKNIELATKVAEFITEEISNTNMDLVLAIGQLALYEFNFDKWLEENTLITGSRAKSHYGFKLHEPKMLGKNNSIPFRDVDLVLKKNASKHFIMLIQILTKCGINIELGREGLASSIPVNAEGGSFPTAIATFQYKNNVYEVFPYSEDIREGASGFVSISTLHKVAKEWQRPKDLFFIEQCEDLLDVNPKSITRLGDLPVFKSLVKNK